MAKKKTRKNSKKKESYFMDLYGILLMLIAIIGIGKYGPVGRFIASFAVFLVGNLYFFLLLFILVMGGYLIIYRKNINFFSSKMLGFYLFLIGILVFLHQNYVLESVQVSKIFSATVDNIMSAVTRIMESKISVGVFDASLSNTGGGILGAIFSTLFYKLFEKDGTDIVVWVLLISGFMIFTGMSIFNIVRNIAEKTKDMIPEKEEKPKKEKVKDKSKIEPVSINDVDSKLKIVDHNDVDKDKLVVHDISQITKVTPEAVNEEAPKVEKVETNKQYKLPPIELLDAPKNKKNNTDHQVIEKNIEILEKVLKDFGIIGRVVEVNIGPTVTQYEMELNSGTKVSKLLSINKEISLALAKKDVRIQAPIPGKSTVGIEMPNDHAQSVSLRETIEGMPKNTNNSLLAVALGKDIMGKVKYCEIDKTPHLLVAGATGSGKSVCINGIIISILMKARPDEVKLVMVDPKKVELGIYNGIPHLLTPVVTDPRKASIALKRAVSEMERRYDLFEELGTKNITSYNKLIEEKNKKLPDDEKYNKMPYIVVIVDELADLMLVAGKEVEDSIMRITQMARAAGIHLIIATQRPSTDVITGLIKANIPSRISFAVSSSIDSRTILDMTGAEKLLGKGDMLFLPMGESAPDRIQGSFVSEEEIKKVVDYTISQQKAQFDSNFMDLDSVDHEKKNNPISDDKEEYDDPLYNEIVEFVVTTGKASASLLQRKFKLGYNRAARIIDLLEERGIIGPQNGSKPREVLIKLEKDDE